MTHQSLSSITEMEFRFFFEANTYVGYSVIKSMLLPSPYLTNCYSYRTSRDNCIEQCVQHETRLKFNSSIVRLVRYSNDTWPTSMGAELEYNRIMLKCSSLNCGNHDCTSETFKLVQKVSLESENFIVSLVPPEMKYVSEYIPKLTLLDFMVYLGGIFGIWLDINLVAIFSLLSKLQSVFCVFTG